MSNRFGTIVLHSALAAAFFFSLQRWMMKESLETSLVWAAAAAIGAALIAWRQTGGR